MRRSIAVVSSLLLLGGACVVENDDARTSLSGSQGAASTGASGAETSGADPGTSGGASSSSEDGASDDTEGGLLLDVAGLDESGGFPLVCDAVDILFVVDSSASMNDEQVALGEAFPQFIDTIVQTLPPGTSIHVGVTTMEMSPDGADSIQIPCDEPNPMYYQTPDDAPSGVDGAQGRLRQLPGQPAFFELDTDAPADEIAAMSEWFAETALVGIDGSSEEMPLAGAGWAFDPVNAATNAGFVRDEGAALVLFFVTDESDQTPVEAAAGLIDRISAAKAGCGGLDCVAAGGTVVENCLGGDALGMFLGALDPSHVHTEPLAYNTQTEADVFVGALKDNLAQIVTELCDSIPPAG